MAIRERNVQPVGGAEPDSSHAAKPVYTASDIALGITFQVAIDEKRSMSVQTHVTRDCDDKELNGVLDKVARATDRLEARYRLRMLKTQLEGVEKTLAQVHEDYARKAEEYSADWVSRGKRGPWQPDGQQKAWQSTSRGLQERHRQEITHLKIMIELCEKQLHEGS